MLDDHKPLIRSLERRGLIRGGLSLGHCSKRPIAIRRRHTGLREIAGAERRLLDWKAVVFVVREPLLRFAAHYGLRRRLIRRDIKNDAGIPFKPTSCHSSRGLQMI